MAEKTISLVAPIVPIAPLNLTNIFWITFVHLMTVAAIPFFTWRAFSVSLCGLFILAPLGINLGYHRMLSHRGFVALPWLRNTLVTLGALAVGGPPIQWVVMHRIHHRFSDTEKDPHNSTKGFWYSHILHLFRKDELELDPNLVQTYAPDLLNDNYIQWLNKYWLLIAISGLPLLYMWGGLPFLMWGGFVRVAMGWHVMWFVNSASHMWGYRNFETKDNTVNCWWVGFLAAGEGWHNNHHADPACAAHGLKWWELDLTYAIILGFEKLGWITGVKHPKKT